MIRGMTLRFLSRGEIAEHLGVTLGTVKQYASFPEPDVIVGRNQGWAVETIDRWQAERRGRPERQARTVDRRERLGVLLGPGLRSDAVASPGLPDVDCGLGQDLRPVPDDSSGREPTSLGTAPLGSAGPEASHGIVGSTEQFVGSGIHDGASMVGVRRIGTEVDLTQRRGVDRRGRGA